MKASAARGAEANSAVRLGLIGCGGRGNWLTDLFLKNGRYRFTALADYFRDRVDATGKRLNVPDPQRADGLSGYKRVLDAPVDAVVIESPPYFHPEQAAAAVEAGKHVYLAKPIAVDAPGCQTIAESGRRATARKLVFIVDFQTRAHPLYREAVKRVRAGDIGRIVSAEAHYPWQGIVHDSPLSTPDDRIRLWYQTCALSGDEMLSQPQLPETETTGPQDNPAEPVAQPESCQSPWRLRAE